MELGALSISPSMLKPMPVSPCFIYRYAALDRPSSKHAELYIRAPQNPPRSFHSAHGRSSTFALSSKSYWAQLYKRKNLETSGGAICPQGNAEQKLEGKRESSIIRSVKACQLRWDSQETKMVPRLVFSPISGAPKNFSKRNHSSSQRPTNSVGTDMRKSGRPVSRCNYQTTSFAFTELRDQIGARATSLDSKIQMPSPAERCRLYQSGAYSSLSNLGWLDFTSFKGRRIDKDGALAVTLEAAVETSASSSPSSGAAQSDSGGNSREKPSKRAGSGASSVSSGVRLEHISKTFKGATLLTDVNWEVKKGEKVGLVGVNGAGKTTQLKIIVGEEEPDTGNVIKAKENMKIAFLTQEFEVIPSRTVREEFMSAFAEQMNISDRIEKVQKALESATDDLILMGNLLDELDGLQRQAEAVDLYDVDVKINKMMPELGFNQEDGDRLVASFSGGWQMRMSLGKILLEDPDLLLLDEPTNHLDLDTIEWLENYLKKQDVPMVIVSHDRAFLDQLCTKIVETDMGVSHTFEGNYSDYVLAKAAWVETQCLAWEKQQKEISRTKDIIMRLSGGANSGRATTAEKQLEKIQEDQLVEKPFEHKQIKFRFPELDRSGRTVVVVKNMGLQYEGKVLFQNANLVVERGEKLAVIGPNGCGKSTLLRMIMGFEEPTSGEVHLGEHGVLPNYFEQNQAEALDLKKTVLQTVEEAAEDWNMNDIRGLLGRCNFKGDMVHRKVAFLSGGEKARLALCNFMVTPSTLLVLDEPTNHLDIPSKEMLEEAIREYRGTVIAVSHDRYFLRQIVNRVVEVKNHALQNYGGDYNYYLEQNLEARRRELEREAELEAKAPTVKAKSKMSKAEKELQKKQKALAFQQGKAKSKVTKNAKRWN